MIWIIAVRKVIHNAVDCLPFHCYDSYTVDHHEKWRNGAGWNKINEVAPVSNANAASHPKAVVVKPLNAMVAVPTMRGSRWPNDFAGGAKTRFQESAHGLHWLLNEYFFFLLCGKVLFWLFNLPESCFCEVFWWFFWVVEIASRDNSRI